MKHLEAMRKARRGFTWLGAFVLVDVVLDAIPLDQCWWLLLKDVPLFVGLVWAISSAAAWAKAVEAAMREAWMEQFDKPESKP